MDPRSGGGGQLLLVVDVKKGMCPCLVQMSLMLRLFSWSFEDVKTTVSYDESSYRCSSLT